MDTNTSKILLAISTVGLAVAGLIFLALSIFDDGRAYLPAGLCCTTLANLFNVIRHQQQKDNINKEY